MICSIFRSFPKFGRDGRKPKVKSNLRAGLANAGGGHKRFPSAAKSEKPASTKFATERQRKKVLLTEKPLPAVVNSVKVEDLADEEDDLFLGPEVRPDGRTARVKADILAENQNKPEPAAAAAPSLEPFIEAFFASPSSPKPFVFTGSPRPADQFGSASTFQPFFVPTAKAGGASSPAPLVVEQTEAKGEAADDNDDDTSDENNNSNEEDNEIEEKTTTVRQQPAQQRQTAEETSIPRPRNRFLTRPSPAAVTARQRPAVIATTTVETVRSVDSSAEESVLDMTEDKAVDESEGQVKEMKNVETVAPPAPKPARPTGFRQRQFVKPAATKGEDCSDPFSCQQPDNGSEAATTGHQPRVKSNITAKKRNFWQKDVAAAPAENGRKLRRGRKQKTPIEEAAENDIIVDEPLVATKKTDGVSLLDELMAGKKEMEEKKTTRTVLRQQTSQQLAPTVRPEAVVQQEPTTTTTTNRASDSFKDLFEEEEEEEEDDDLIVSSSTVSAVVFKGSPTPSPFGFFSSPQPDWDGPSRASIGGGGFAGSPRPTFNNIGNDINLGPEKKPSRFLPLDQLFFVSSTQSNKIVIGALDEVSDEKEDEEEVEEDEESTEEEDEEEEEEEELFTTRAVSTTTTTPAPTTTAAASAEAAKRPSPFPSFPIRGKLLAGGAGLSFPFRQPKKESAVETEEKVGVEETTDTTTSVPVSSTTAAEHSSLATSTVPATTRFSAFNRRPNNLAFLGRKPADVVSPTTTSKAVAADQTTAVVASDEVDEEQTATMASNEEAAATTSTETTSTTLKIQHPPIITPGRFPLKPQLNINNNNNNNFPSGLPGRSRNFQTARKEAEKSTTTPAVTTAAVETTLVPVTRTTTTTAAPVTSPAVATTAQVNVLSVESILSDDDNENELDSDVSDDDEDEEVDNDSEEEEEEDMDESRNFEKKLLTKQRQPPAAAVVPSVKKALGPPPNANIRVEFKKATAPPASTAEEQEEEEGTKKFFVKPDGRKPRVKSNIRSVNTVVNDNTLIS